jgi:CubicO group peptidase (beta-lactamase class C family)
MKRAMLFLHRLLGLFAPCALLLALPPTVAGATEPSIYRTYLAECHARHICNGTYLLARDGKPVFSGAFGDSGDEARTPLTVESAFDIGSISKEFTAMAVLQQVAAGKISLDGRVAEYLPGFPYPEVTVAQLLSHTSGIADAMPYYTNLVKKGGPGFPVTFKDIVSVLADNHMPAAAPPGVRFAYSNTGYVVLAALVEKVAEQPFDEYLEESFFKPLGMGHTYLLIPGTEAAIGHRAFGFADSPVGGRRAIDQIPGVYLRGAGGIYSTAPDLLRWMNALEAGRVVPRKLLERAMTPARLSDGSSVPYGFGLSLEPDALGGHRVSHGGHWRAFKSDLSWYPETDIMVIQLTNNNQDDSVDANAAALADIASGGTPSLPPESIGWQLAGRLSDRDSARAWFMEELSRSPRRYDIAESGLNHLGYACLERKETEAAITVFKLATLAFPKSANAFDSLADAYEAAGDFRSAYESVQSALALDPASTAYAGRARMLKSQLP